MDTLDGLPAPLPDAAASDLDRALDTRRRTRAHITSRTRAAVDEALNLDVGAASRLELASLAGQLTGVLEGLHHDHQRRCAMTIPQTRTIRDLDTDSTCRPQGFTCVTCPPKEGNHG